VERPNRRVGWNVADLHEAEAFFPGQSGIAGQSHSGRLDVQSRKKVCETPVGIHEDFDVPTPQLGHNFIIYVRPCSGSLLPPFTHRTCSTT